MKDQNLVKELRPRDLLESSSDSDEKVPLAKPSSLSKRKLELEVETVEKKKKGRPRKDSRLLPMSLSVQVRPMAILHTSTSLPQAQCWKALHAIVCVIGVGHLRDQLDPVQTPCNITWRLCPLHLYSTNPTPKALVSAHLSVRWESL